MRLASMRTSPCALARGEYHHSAPQAFNFYGPNPPRVGKWYSYEEVLLCIEYIIFVNIRNISNGGVT